MTRPIVFLTDYGLADDFVGVCRGVMLRIAPDARIHDAHVHGVGGHVRRRASERERAPEHVLPRDRVREIDDPGIGRDPQHDAAADTDELVRQPVVGQEDDRPRHVSATYCPNQPMIRFRAISLWLPSSRSVP